MQREIIVMDCEERGAFWLTLRSDYTIHFTTTAAEGLEMLSDKTGVVFVSLTLADINGMEVLGLIARKYPLTPVIIIAPCRTGEPCRCMEAFRRGAWDYVRKPLKAEDILKKITIFTGEDGGPDRQKVIPQQAKAVAREHYPNVPAHIAQGVLKVRDFVAQNYSESLSLSAACKMAATSKTYFCRFFKRITGHSLRSYHNVVRVQMAEHFLRDKRLSVSDVATRLGYHDSNYFSTIYKRMTGAPPKCRGKSVQALAGIRVTKEEAGKTLEYIGQRQVLKPGPSRSTDRGAGGFSCSSGI